MIVGVGVDFFFCTRSVGVVSCALSPVRRSGPVRVLSTPLPSSSYRCEVVPSMSNIGEVVSPATVSLFFSFLVDQALR